MIGEVEEEGKEEERTKCGARKGQKLVKNTKGRRWRGGEEKETRKERQKNIRKKNRGISVASVE